MVKTTGTTNKAKYLYKIHKEDINDKKYLKTKLPRRANKISKHAKKRMKEKGFYVTGKELSSLLTYENLLDIQVTFTGEVTFVFRGNLGREYDTSFVINTSGKVISVWANDKKDNHKTLDESIYRKDVSIYDIL